MYENDFVLVETKTGAVVFRRSEVISAEQDGDTLYVRCDSDEMHLDCEDEETARNAIEDIAG